MFQGGRFQFDLRASTGPFLSKPDKEPINLFKDGRFENGFHAEVTGTWWYFDGLICLKNEKSGGKPIVSDFSEQYRGQKASVIYILDNSNNLILAPFNSGLDRTSLIYRRIDKP